MFFDFKVLRLLLGFFSNEKMFFVFFCYSFFCVFEIIFDEIYNIFILYYVINNIKYFKNVLYNMKLIIKKLT